MTVNKWGVAQVRAEMVSSRVCQPLEKEHEGMRQL